MGQSGRNFAVTQGALLTNIWGSDVELSPLDPGGLGFTISKKPEAEVATMDLFCFFYFVLCHCKDNNYAYTFATRCMQQF